jgi:hypothetical protein
MAEPTGRCFQCGAPIGALFMRPTPDFPAGDTPTRSGSIHAMDPTGYFCKLRCAARYGVKAARNAGVDVPREGQQ